MTDINIDATAFILGAAIHQCYIISCGISPDDGALKNKHTYICYWYWKLLYAKIYYGSHLGSCRTPWDYDNNALRSGIEPKECDHHNICGVGVGGCRAINHLR